MARHLNAPLLMLHGQCLTISWVFMNLWLDVTRKVDKTNTTTAHWWIAVVLSMIRLMNVRIRSRLKRIMQHFTMENCAKHKAVRRRSEHKLCAARIHNDKKSIKKNYGIFY